MNRRQFLMGTIGAGAVAVVGTGCSSDAGSSGHVKGATAITQVYGAGQKLIAVGVEYDADIDTSKLALRT